jgi:hypothetical protein
MSIFVPFIIKVVYLFVIGLLLAVIEIQIEGKGGWAATLPTWRPNESSKIGQWYLRLTKKDLTGYHLALMPFLFLFFHWPFLMGLPWTFLAELETLAFFILFAVFWDFLWFVLNPHYSLRKFGPKQVWWHRKWLGRIPIDYVFGILITTALFIPIILNNPLAGITKLILLLGGISLLTAITIIIYPKAY